MSLTNPAHHWRSRQPTIAGNFKVLSPWLNRSVAIADALSERRPVWRRPSSKKAAAQWRELCDNLLTDYGVLKRATTA